MRDLIFIVRDMVIPEITKDAKHILFHLASREGENAESWASQRTLALTTNISVKGVQRAINCLLEHNLITRESGKLQGKTNRYRVTIPAAYIQEYYANRKPSRKRAQKVSHHDLQGKPPPMRRCDTVTYIRETNNEENKGKSVRSSTDRPTVAKIDAVKTCYNFGASKDEAEKFWRYNEAKGWPLLKTMTLADIARRWIDEWQRKEPESYAYEVERRRQAAQEQRLRAMIAKVRAEKSQNTRN